MEKVFDFFSPCDSRLREVNWKRFSESLFSRRETQKTKCATLSKLKAAQSVFLQIAEAPHR
jgi:hypothetical protein